MKLEVLNLSKSFEKKEVLKNIDFTFEDNKIYGLLGRNGAGKKTFFIFLNAVIKPDSGTFYIVDNKKRKLTIDDIGYVISSTISSRIFNSKRIFKILFRNQ